MQDLTLLAICVTCLPTQFLLFKQIHVNLHSKKKKKENERNEF